MRTIDLLFCQLSYWVEVWRAVHGKRVAVVIRRTDGGQSQVLPDAVVDLRRFGAEVVELEPAWTEVAWEAYGDASIESPEELYTQAEYFLVAREWRREDEALGGRPCVSTVVRQATRSPLAREVISLHRSERSFYWSVRLLACALTADRCGWRDEGGPVPFESPRMMTRQVETMGDFVKRFERSDEGRDAMRTVEFVMNLDDGEVERAETARQWREFNVSPLALAEVEVLADAVFSAYQWALGGAGEETYGLLRDEARDALRELQHLASELGLYECAQALDPEQPLTPSEVMVDAGYAEISDDGRIKLTDLGEAVARSVEKDPGDPENN